MNDFSNTESQRSAEVDELLERNNVSREEVTEKYYTCPMVLCENHGKKLPASAVMMGITGAICPESKDEMVEVEPDAPSTMTAAQRQHIEMLGLTKRIDVAVECRKKMQCEIDELDEHNAGIFIGNLQRMYGSFEERAATAAEIKADKEYSGASDNENPDISDVERQREASKQAAVHTETAAQATVSDLVPEFGATLAKREVTALAYDFPPAVQTLIEKAKLSTEDTQKLLGKFGDLFGQIGNWRVEVESIEIAGAHDEVNIKRAKEILKTISTERLNSEKRKKLIKEPFLRPCQLIDGVFKIYIDEVVPLEKKAEGKAKFVENLIKEQKEQIRAEREVKLSPFVENIKTFNLHPDVMTDEAFSSILDTNKELFAAREANRQREETERQRREDEAAAERVKLRRQTERRTELSSIGFTRDNENNRYVLEDLTVYDSDIEGESDSTWIARIDQLKPKAEAIIVERNRKQKEADALIEQQKEADRLATDAKAREAREKEAAELAPDKIKLERLAEVVDGIAFFETSNEKINDILGSFRGDLTAAVMKLRSQIKQLP